MSFPAHEDPESESSEPVDADNAASEWSSEEEELDRLYRQALDVVDDIEREMQLPWEVTEVSPDEETGVSDAPTTLPFSSAASENAAATEVGVGAPADEPRVTPRQVLEAALFVGGGPLTTKALIHVLRDEFSAEFIDDLLESLNQSYASEGRPYEIRLTEGGWQMQLRPAFEKVRHRVYGLGPKEVKLSQEALEVLAVVAYHQPVTSESIVELGKASPNGALRQLLRRELIAIERGEGGRKDVKYRTTSRFLQLFDIEDLDDLPQAEEIAFK